MSAEQASLSKTPSKWSFFWDVGSTVFLVLVIWFVCVFAGYGVSQAIMNSSASSTEPPVQAEVHVDAAIEPSL